MLRGHQIFLPESVTSPRSIILRDTCMQLQVVYELTNSNLFFCNLRQFVAVVRDRKARNVGAEGVMLVAWSHLCI